VLRDCRQDLVDHGHYVTSRWIDSEIDSTDEDACALCARTDFVDVVTADTIVSFTEAPRCASRGARHVEFGIALGLQKRMIIVGPREHVFHFYSGVERFECWGEFLSTLTGVAPFQLEEGGCLRRFNESSK
jgi:hypothetical protein